MKSNKSFQKSKKSGSYFEDRESRIKKVGGSQKKQKNFNRELHDEMDDYEEFDLFGNKDDIPEDEDE